MKIVTPPLDISNIEGFKQDVLGREAYGKALLNLISRSNDELVISLRRTMGGRQNNVHKDVAGITQWVRSPIPNIYIDAFANDYLDDAFISVASAITGYANTNTI